MKRCVHVNIAWWNTSLHPPVLGGVKRVHTTESDVIDEVKRLMRKYGIIVLGEFRDMQLGVDMAAMQSGWQYYDLCCCKNRRHFNTGLLAKKSIVEPLKDDSVEAITKVSEDDAVRKYRVGQRVMIEIMPIRAVLGLYIAHWGMFTENNSIDRKCDAASRLLSRMALSKDCDLKLCMGDFNVEPYMKPMVYNLRGSRSREFVRRHGGLYNPFWRYLNESCGTLRFEEKETILYDRPLFDQILVGRDFAKKRGVSFVPVIERFPECADEGAHAPVGLRISFRKG